MDKTNRQQEYEQRLVAVEEWMMHTDRLLGDLNAAACSIQDRLDQQQRMLARLEQAIERLTSGDEPPRTLEDERPPHY